MASIVPTGGPTPPQEEAPSNAYATYVPRDIRYSAEFEDALARVALAPGATRDGIRVIPDYSDEQPVDGVSVRAQDVSLQSLPQITENELPLALDDPRRVFRSPVPGVRLTHPGGYLEGGPGLNPDIDTFPDEFLSGQHASLATPVQLRKVVEKEVNASVEQLMERLRARQRARVQNERIAKELKSLTDQHDLELNLHRRMLDEREKKREAKERKAREKQEKNEG